MEVAGVERNPVTYSTAINGCTRNGQWQIGLQLLQEMGTKGVVQPDAPVFNAAISACEKGKAWETALRLMDKMRALGIPPTTVTYGAAISACEKGGQVPCF
jgi:pentatricopeptide repeat domain-containing protein 1